MSDCGCDEAKANVYELLRGELCAEESAPIREHIDHCADCSNEELVCSQLTDVIRRVCEEERENCAPADLRDAILRGLNAAV